MTFNLFYFGSMFGFLLLRGIVFYIGGLITIDWLVWGLFFSCIPFLNFFLMLYLLYIIIEHYEDVVLWERGHDK